MSYHFSPELDGTKLNELYFGDPEMAREVFEAFMKETVAIIPGLETAFRNNDKGGFRQLLHKIKPGFLYVGLTPIFEKMSWAENACNQISSLDSLEQEFNEIIKMINEKMPIVKKELEQLQRVSGP